MKIYKIFKRLLEKYWCFILYGLQRKHYARKVIDKAKESFKVVLITGFVFLLVVAFLVGGAIYTTSPVFCKSCHVMVPYYNDWNTSTHSSIGCVTCHIEPGFMNQVLGRARTAIYIIRFFLAGSGNIGTSKPSNNVCLQCHIAEKRVTAAGDLIIPHPLHVTKMELTCLECHSNLVHHRPKGAKKSVVPMETCLTCHNGKKATDRCDACHTEKAYPASHKRPDWLKVHGALSKTENCNECHGWRPDWCSECHQKKPASHIGRWRTNHRFKVAPDRKNCLACHKTQFCVRCHGVMP